MNYQADEWDWLQELAVNGKVRMLGILVVILIAVLFLEVP